LQAASASNVHRTRAACSSFSGLF